MAEARRHTAMVGATRHTHLLLAVLTAGGHCDASRKTHPTRRPPTAVGGGGSPADGRLVDVAPAAFWRIQAVRSGGFFFADARGRLMVSQRYFSLFRVVALGSGAYSVVCHPSNRTVYHQPAVAKQGVGTRVSSLVMDSELSYLALLPPSRNRRRIHSNPLGGSMYAPTTSPPPAPSLTEEEVAAPYRAKEIHTRFFLVAQPRGGVAVRVGTTSSAWYVHEAANSALEVWDVNPRRRQRYSSPLPESACFQLLPVAMEPEPAGRRRNGGAPRTPHLSARRIKQSAVLVGERHLVVVTAYDLHALDHTPYFLGWLNASGIRRLLHLHTDGVSCGCTRRLNPLLAQAVEMDCVACEELAWPTGAYEKLLGHSMLSDWETAANEKRTRLLRRCKLRLLDMVLRARVDALYLDPAVLITSPSYLATLAALAKAADLAIASDAQLGFSEPVQNDFGCLATPKKYLPYVHDWVGSAQLFFHSTAAGRWFVKEAQSLMDLYGLSDVDAIQSLLTGHAQVADPMRAGAEPGAQFNASSPHEAWLKPAWLEAVDEPLFYRALAFQKWIRPLNAPLHPDIYRRYVDEKRRRAFSWVALPEEQFITSPYTLIDSWSTRFGRSLGSIRVDGTRSGDVQSVQVSCQMKQLLAKHEHSQSFLFFPESLDSTWKKFCEDFPSEAAAMANAVRMRGVQPPPVECATSTRGSIDGRSGSRKGRHRHHT
ncbi:hypothetical protein AB1Y20_015232 [Prymnesium parvum]|uniref:Protein xylosyltransferase n=1 Tax=Prymnesium parvum TaxID=97485 RepID=A0AB34JZI1_PRYPA